MSDGTIQLPYRATAPTVTEASKIAAWVDLYGNIHYVNSSGNDTSLADGWIAANETWTYSSADAPVYVFTAGSGAASRYSAGMKIRYTQSGSTSYGIIHAVSGSAVTFYGGTDYVMSGSAITSPYYSTHKAPYGFPLDPTRWTVELSDTSEREQRTPTQNVYYNIGSVSITPPMGAWYLTFQGGAGCYKDTSTSKSVYVALSTANNSVSDTELLTFVDAWTYATSILRLKFHISKTLVLAAKTTYYPIIKTADNLGAGSSVSFNNGAHPMLIRFLCAYL